MKERGNKLFAGSRMILPEHRIGMEALKTRLDRDYHKPIFDEQYLAELNEIILEAIERDNTLVFTIDNDIYSKMLAAKPIKVINDKLIVLTEQGKQAIRLTKILAIKNFK